MDFFRKTPKKKSVDPHEPIPIGDAQESDWAAWQDSVAFQESLSGDFRDTEKLPLLPELDALVDAYASVTKKSG
jgi:hypothetical protein